jgi:hypothetical protein
MQFEILEIVFALKIARVAQARVTDVDRRYSRVGLPGGMSRGLRGAAASDQDLLVLTWWLVGPHKVDSARRRSGFLYRSRCASKLASGAGYGILS